MADLVFDKSGKAYTKAHRTPTQQAEQDAKDRSYFDWAEAKMSKTFTGTLAEFRAAQAAQEPLADLTVTQLRVKATTMQIRGRWKMRKAQLIEAIEAIEAGNPAPGELLQIMLEGVR